MRLRFTGPLPIGGVSKEWVKEVTVTLFQKAETHQALGGGDYGVLI